LIPKLNLTRMLKTALLNSPPNTPHKPPSCKCKKTALTEWFTAPILRTL
jgi:hypothetical protein